MSKSQIDQSTNAQEPQDMKATRHEMYMSMLCLKHLTEVRDEKQKSMYAKKHE